MKPYLTILFSCYLSLIQAQTIPSDRLVDWDQAGCQINVFTPKAHLKIYPVEGSVSDHERFEKALKELSEKGGGELEIAAGVYQFNKTLVIPGNILFKGSGAGKTIFNFDGGGVGHGFVVQGRETQNIINLKKEPQFQAPYILAQKASKDLKGKWFKIIRPDSALAFNNWAYGHTGQIVQIQRVSGDTLFLSDQIRDAYKCLNSCRIRELEPVQNVHLECFTFNRLDKSDRQLSNIHFINAANCRVVAIESNKTTYAHVEARNSIHIDVLGCYFFDGHSHGTGGRAYGVMLHQGTNSCLVMDNIGNRLRHSFITQSGGNGSVFAYNFSVNPLSTTVFFGVSLNSSITSDFAMHGNYVYANLLEGNSAAMYLVDDSHGRNGPLNTFFRNYASGRGISVIQSASHRQNFIGNEVRGPWVLLARDHFQYGNKILNSSNPTEEVVAQKNLFKNRNKAQIQPDFEMNWANATSLKEFTLPAEGRFISENEDFIPVNEAHVINKTAQIRQKSKEKRKPWWRLGK